MRNFGIQRAGWLIALWLWAGCGGSSRAPETSASPVADDPRSVEATSLLGRPLFATPPDNDRPRQEALLRAARERLARQPDDPDAWIWVGRRLGYLWRMNEAIDVYTRGIERHPNDAALYRHRGHRYITLRQFDKAIVDLQRASRLIAGLPEIIEQDGLPNERNIPLTTLQFNVWYHLGVAHYAKGDFEKGREAFDQAMQCRGKYDDNLVAVTDWLYMALRRMGRDAEAASVLTPIRADMDIIENQAYLKRVRMYKRETRPEEVFDVEKASELDLATMGYGVGNWYLCEGDQTKAVQVFEKVVSGGYWPAFGFIAAEADLARMKNR